MNKTNFNQIIGNQVTVSILQNLIASDNIAPAYLFTGKLGIGKFKTALLFAQNLVGSDIEILIIEPQQSDNSNAMSIIKIEQMHEIITFCATKPAIGKRKAVIINAFGGLSEKCGNALLKTLEEPPQHVTIIIVSSHEILPTIKSRCHHILFKQLTNEDMKIVLSSLGHNHVSDAVINAAYGSVGKALQIIQVWDEISVFLKELSAPPTTISTALAHSNNITTTLDHQTQVLLLQLLISTWWKKHDTQLLQKGTVAMSYLKCKVSPRAVWDNLLIPS